MNLRSILMPIVALMMPALSLAEPGLTSSNLVQSSASWDGSTMDYPDGTPQITISKITVAHGAQVPLHCHPSPLGAYVVSGAIKVIKPSGEEHTFLAGEAFVEVSQTWHRGYGAGDGTELIVFYAGSVGLPLSLGEDGDPELAAHCE